MKGYVGWLRDALAANLWLVPLVAFVVAFALSQGLLAFDRTVDTSANAWFVYGGSPQGARQMLSTIAGSMITFIGLVFSSTILVLQLASSQFSPRILRSFFSDRIIQGALATFIATFAYAILVLREVREEAGHSFVPGLSTFVAISLVWLSLAMFVVYIDHIGARIRAVSIIATAAKATLKTVRSLQAQRPRRAEFVRPAFAAQVIRARIHGVIADVDAKRLLRFAEKHDAMVEVVPMAGDFVIDGSPLIFVWCGRELDADFAKSIASCISIERDRTMRSDVLFGIRQLVDIADKALSPGINDPTTAVQALDQLHEVLRVVAASAPGSDTYAGTDAVARVLVPAPTWKNYLDHALEEIILYGRGSIPVSRRIRTLVIDLEQSVIPENRPALRAYRERIEALIADTFTTLEDRAAASRLPRSTEMRDINTLEQTRSLEREC